MRKCHCLMNLLSRKKCFLPNLIPVSLYSRRSNSKNPDFYKVIKTDAVSEIDNVFSPSRNWELLTPPGYRFYLPGSVGPAWQNTATTLIPDDLQVALTFQNHCGKAVMITNTAATMECIAQECPVLLRQGALEVFPGLASPGMQLTIITLSQKVRATDIEELSKHFVLAARDVCSKLKQAGYAADFVNPFSGRPYVGTFHSPAGDARKEFDCFAFRIVKHANCRVITEHKGSQEFVGMVKRLKDTTGHQSQQDIINVAENIINVAENIYVLIGQGNLKKCNIVQMTAFLLKLGKTTVLK